VSGLNWKAVLNHIQVLSQWIKCCVQKLGNDLARFDEIRRILVRWGSGAISIEPAISILVAACHQVKSFDSYLRLKVV
jgi:hypothetical protein